MLRVWGLCNFLLLRWDEHLLFGVGAGVHGFRSCSGVGTRYGSVGASLAGV